MGSNTWQLQKYQYGTDWVDQRMATRISRFTGWVLLTMSYNPVGTPALLVRFQPTGPYDLTTTYPTLCTKPHFPYGFAPTKYVPW